MKLRPALNGSDQQSGELAKKLDVEMGVHSPYYSELAYPPDSLITKKNLDVIKDDAIVSDFLDASYITIHIGPYHEAGLKGFEEGSPLPNFIDRVLFNLFT